MPSIALQGTDTTCELVLHRPAAGVPSIAVMRALAITILCLVAMPLARADERPLEDTPNVCGRVIDEQGRPLEGVRVYLAQYYIGGIDVTDERGRFCVTAAPNMAVPMLIRVPGYTDYEGAVRAGTTGLQIVLKRGASITGRVKAPAGVKLPSALRMTFIDRRSRRFKVPLAGDGTFTISGISHSDTERQLSIHVAGFSAFALTVKIGASALKRPQDIGAHQLEHARPVLIRVLDQAGQPVDGADVAIYGEPANWRWKVTTDAKGLASFPRTTNQDLIVHARTEGGELRSSGLRIPAGKKAAKHTLVVRPR